MDHFELVSEYKPTGDQPQAIADLVKGFKEGRQPVPDPSWRHRLRKDFHDGECYPATE